MVPSVGPGGTATFDVTLHVDSIPFTAAFNANFVDTATGTVLGTVPFQINLPSVPPTIPPAAQRAGDGPPGSPSDPPTVTAGTRLGRQFQPTTIYITFSGPMNVGIGRKREQLYPDGARGQGRGHRLGDL